MTKTVAQAETHLVHLYGRDERAPPLSDDVNGALDGGKLGGERRRYASISDLVGAMGA